MECMQVKLLLKTKCVHAWVCPKYTEHYWKRGGFIPRRQEMFALQKIPHTEMNIVYWILIFQIQVHYDRLVLIHCVHACVFLFQVRVACMDACRWTGNILIPAFDIEEFSIYVLHVWMYIYTCMYVVFIYLKVVFSVLKH